MEAKRIPIEDRIIVALDVPGEREAREVVERLAPKIGFFKVGLELFLAGGFSLVDEMVKQGLKVMLDLKFFDVPNTVAAAVRQVSGRGITYTTVHGDDAILEAAAGAARGVGVLAVTVLTSLDDSDLREMGYGSTVADLVAARAKRARELGCAGVVCSGREAKRVREELGREPVIVTPGIRPAATRDDQKRVVGPKDAILSGADHLVVGRPIREAQDPSSVVEEMHGEVREALALLDNTP
jgi:orotidine-5'-phosphate decarboxylase